MGISQRTNEAGALAVANAFPDFPVTPIKTNEKGVLHLKEVMTMGGSDIIIVGQDKISQEIAKVSLTLISQNFFQTERAKPYFSHFISFSRRLNVYVKLN